MFFDEKTASICIAKLFKVSHIWEVLKEKKKKMSEFTHIAPGNVCFFQFFKHFYDFYENLHELYDNTFNLLRKNTFFTVFSISIKCAKSH